MGLQNRKILFFLDNATSHPHDLKLKNIKIYILPTNTNACCQPRYSNIAEVPTNSNPEDELRILFIVVEMCKLIHLNATNNINFETYVRVNENESLGTMMYRHIFDDCWCPFKREYTAITIQKK